MPASPRPHRSRTMRLSFSQTPRPSTSGRPSSSCSSSCRSSAAVAALSCFRRSRPMPLSAYAATKGAVDTLVKHFAFVLGGRGIRVNAVAPGVVETDMSNFTKTDAGRDFALGMQALKRLAQPDDIGGVVAFLANWAYQLDQR